MITIARLKSLEQMVPEWALLPPKVEADIQLDKVECARLLGDKGEVAYSLYTNTGYADDRVWRHHHR